MKLNNVGELALLREIRDSFRKRDKGLITGIGDDAAVIAPFKERLLITSDMMVEGVHFDLTYTTPFQLGYRSVAVNVSDIYAMAGVPGYLFLDLAIRKNTDMRFVESFFMGVKRALNRFGVILAGGDLSSSREIVVVATVTGKAKQPVLRSGAMPGDRIYVTGSLGESACGLEILKRLRVQIPFEDRDKLQNELKHIKKRLSKIGLEWETARPLIKRHLFTGLRQYPMYPATAMMDVSDGLFIDLMRLCDESKVGARIDVRKIPISKALKKACSILKLDPYRLVTSGGEDYELLFTASPGRKFKALCIGEVTSVERSFIDDRGFERPLKAEGYQHWQ